MFDGFRSRRFLLLRFGLDLLSLCRSEIEFLLAVTFAQKNHFVGLVSVLDLLLFLLLLATFLLNQISAERNRLLYESNFGNVRLLFQFVGFTSPLPLVILFLALLPLLLCP